MVRFNREAQLHADWIGMAQPDGLVVAVPVLEEAGVYVRRPLEDQQAFRAAAVDERLPDLDTLIRLLGWPADRVSTDVEEFRVDLPDLDATLEPTRVVRDRSGQPLLLVAWSDEPLEQAPSGTRWRASHAERFERLLLEKRQPIGLHVCPDEIRLVYAPPGEAPGRLSFPVLALCAADGRPLLDALHMLLGSGALFTRPPGTRLPELLRASRKRQEQVTEDLAEQVEQALRILLTGFDVAHERSGGVLLQDVTSSELYDGLTTVLLRLVFLLYAEDRGLLPLDLPLYEQHYSVTGLANQLQRDRVHHASAMDRRFGAWARLLTLFRMVWSGARYGDLHLPERRGDLFEPDRFPFLEGRTTAGHRTERARVPQVDDGVLADVLDRLLYLDQQRISYRNLEVEQLGSVYESLMGFDVRKAAGPCLVLRPSSVVVELHALREAADPLRHLADALGERPNRIAPKVPDLRAFRPTDDIDADLETLREALQPLARRDGALVLPGRHYLQPGQERRRSGSHYTPRSLTEPIVARTLGPVLDRRGPPDPERILGLRVCDPAAGSGAFLAEACRYLGHRLVEAWARTGTTPVEALQREPTLYARRLVAERCLYGVDKNPRAVQLARLSLWLVTSAADLPFTFLDHAIKEGDALVGLDLDQIATFSFDRRSSAPFWDARILEAATASATRVRNEITARQQSLTFSRHDEKKGLLRVAEDEVWDERQLGDLVVAAAWDAGGRKAVEKRLRRAGDLARAWYPSPDKQPLPHEVQALLDALPLRPFHWALEFPEVFTRKDPGFDCVIGNPPFGGKNTILASNGAPYIKLLQCLWPHAHGGSDLAAYFFLRAKDLLRDHGTFGLVASNTISQGNTRETGLKHLVDQGGITLYDATVDQKWPVSGAAVVVSIVHGSKGPWRGELRLDGEVVEGIATELRAGVDLPDPVRLAANAALSFQGSNVLGSGFVLTLEEAARLRAADPANVEIVRDYIGGQELNSNWPDAPEGHIPHSRCVIDFGARSLEEAEQWPELLAIVREKVKPERDRLNDNPDGRRRKTFWWQFGRRVPGLDAAVAPLDRCLAASLVSKHLLFAFQPSDRTFSHKLAVFAFDDWYHFAVLQSRVHEPWAWDRSSTMKQDLNYTPSRCFETFPFPRPTNKQRNDVAEAGEALYRCRQAIMVRDRQGMTAVWNRLVDPGCVDPDIKELRRLRERMDRTVLAAYGWSDLAPTDRDALLTRLRKLNARRAAEERRGT